MSAPQPYAPWMKEEIEEFADLKEEDIDAMS